MLFRTMPGTNEEVSILGFGAMRLPLLNPKDQKDIDEETSTKMIRLAIDGGVNYVDSAYVYHGQKSESVVGRALQNGYREKVFLATKLPTWMVEKPEDMDRFLDEQLERYKTDKIDFYLIHSLNRDLWKKMKDLGFQDFLERAQKAGKITHRGFSFHGDRENFKEIVDGYDWAFCQIMYNYLDEEFQAGREGMEYAANKGLGIVIMEPLRGGKIAGKVPKAVAEIWDEAETKRTPVEWALRWIWDHAEPSIVLSGMSALEHVEENLRIASDGRAGSLTDAERGLVDRVKKEYKTRVQVNCTSCGYCLPCSSGVDIPGCFSCLNSAHVFDNFEMMKKAYPMILSESERASQCTECGECVEKCPQEIDIPTEMKRVAETFEG
ncbi:MAG: aldo/keto reductase [Planctomycetota bacterium]|jgi:predicted aldo/keto reductase-like oxidoreductase